MDALLEVKGLHVDIPLEAGILHAVRGVDIAVERGKTLALVGESGCGKSLSVLSIMDLLPKKANWHADKIFFDGQNLDHANANQMTNIRGSKIAMIFQEPMTSLNPCYTIGNQLEEALLVHRNVSVKEARDRAVFLLEKVGITAAASRLRQYPHQLSGGLRQRVAIARALMMNPELVICDEPTSALDVSVQSQILNLLLDLRDQQGLTYLIITHDLSVVEHIATRVAVMYLGRIVEEADTKPLFNNPRHPYTHALLSSVLTPEPQLGLPKTHLGIAYPNPIDPPSGCTFHPRCPKASQACKQSRPQASVASGHMVECHHPEAL